MINDHIMIEKSQLLPVQRELSGTTLLNFLNINTVQNYTCKNFLQKSAGIFHLVPLM